MNEILGFVIDRFSQRLRVSRRSPARFATCVTLRSNRSMAFKILARCSSSERVGGLSGNDCLLRLSHEVQVHHRPECTRPAVGPQSARNRPAIGPCSLRPAARDRPARWRDRSRVAPALAVLDSWVNGIYDSRNTTIRAQCAAPAVVRFARRAAGVLGGDCWANCVSPGSVPENRGGFVEA